MKNVKHYKRVRLESHINILLNAAENRHVRDRAELAGVTVGAYVRGLVEQDMVRVTKETIEQPNT